MKKKILSTAIIATVAIVAGWNYQQSENEMELSDLALANVEALAQSEGDYQEKIWERYYREDNTGYNCIKTGSETCL